MKKYRDLILVLSLVILPFLLMSCGSSGSGGGGGNDSAPSLSNFNHPSTVYRGQTYAYTIDYFDPDGDIEMGYYTETWSGGSITKSFTAEELGISDTSGTVTFVITISIYATVGNHHVEVWVEDADHHTSNRLEADIKVR